MRAGIGEERAGLRGITNDYSRLASPHEFHGRRFLYFEKPTLPLHIGSISVLDGPLSKETLSATWNHECIAFRAIGSLLCSISSTCATQSLSLPGDYVLLSDERFWHRWVFAPGVVERGHERSPDLRRKTTRHFRGRKALPANRWAVTLSAWTNQN